MERCEKIKTKCKRLVIPLLLCLIPSACGIAENEPYETEDTASEVVSESGLAEDDNLAQMDIEQATALLDHDLLSIRAFTSARWVEDMIREEICDSAEAAQGSFEAMVSEHGVIPDGLVILLEEAFYHSVGPDIRKADSAYQKVLADLGANQYEMSLEDLITAFPEVEAAKEQLEDRHAAIELLSEQTDAPCDIGDIFHMEGNRYLFEWKSGGSDGAMSVRLTEYQDGSFHTLIEFEICHAGGRLIKYENDFYYIFLLDNSISADFHDDVGTIGMRIYKIGENAAVDNLSIYYLPKEYLWEEQDSSPEFPGLGNYIELLQSKAEYWDIADGYASRYFQPCIRGDEIKVTDIDTDNLKYPSAEVYQADVANLGFPVYIQWCRESNGYEIRFSLMDSKTNMLQELEQLSIDEGSHPLALRLVDMWFKEIDGKTLTFSLYYVSDYSYLLNAVLLEGGEAKPINAWILLPQREFVLSEGEVFSTKG